MIPQCYQRVPSGTVVGVAITVCFTCVAFLILGCVFVQGPLDFGAHQLHKICALGSLLIRLGSTCTHTILDWSAILVKATTIACVVALERPSMLLCTIRSACQSIPPSWISLQSGSQLIPSCTSLQPPWTYLGLGTCSLDWHCSQCSLVQVTRLQY